MCESPRENIVKDVQENFIGMTQNLTRNIKIGLVLMFINCKQANLFFFYYIKLKKLQQYIFLISNFGGGAKIPVRRLNLNCSMNQKRDNSTPDIKYMNLSFRKSIILKLLKNINVIIKNKTVKKRLPF